MIIQIKTFLFSITTFLLILAKFSNGTSLCESVNVKTVLWKTTDTCRKCWGKQDLLKAYARRVAQDLLPRRVPRNMPLLLEYLTLSWEQIPKKTADGSMERYILTVALADTLGGYLQAVALPIANEAYYAGNVDYKVMAQLYFLFDELKMELGTDGGGWSKPCDMKRIPTRVTSLDLSGMNDNEDSDACKDVHIPAKNINNKTSSCPVDGKNSKQILTKIPLPFLDDDQHPNAIAVPFRGQLLYSLHSMNSAHILVRYYITALKCIGKKDKVALQKFNHLFHHWIITNVVPHLHEKNKWYVGFGSVMRVIETMHQKGWSPPPECPGCGSNGGSPPNEGNKVIAGGGGGRAVGGGGGGVGGGGGLSGIEGGSCTGGGENGGGGITGGVGNVSSSDATGNDNVSSSENTSPIPNSSENSNDSEESCGSMQFLYIIILAIILILFCLCCCCCVIRRRISKNDDYVPLLSLYYKYMKGNEEGDEGANSKFSDFDDNATGATVNTDRGPSNPSSDKQYASDTEATTTGTSETEDRMPRKRSK